MRTEFHGLNLQGVSFPVHLYLVIEANRSQDEGTSQLMQNKSLSLRIRSPSNTMIAKSHSQLRVPSLEGDSMMPGNEIERASSSAKAFYIPGRPDNSSEDMHLFSRLSDIGFPNTDERLRPWQKRKRCLATPKDGKVLVKCSGIHCYGRPTWTLCAAHCH